jgi:transposase
MKCLFVADESFGSLPLMTIPGVGQLIALAFIAAIDDPPRIRRSRDVDAYLGLVPKRYQSGRSTTSAAARNAATGGCGPCCTRPPTSC